MFRNVRIKSLQQAYKRTDTRYFLSKSTRNCTLSLAHKVPAISSNKSLRWFSTNDFDYATSYEKAQVRSWAPESPAELRKMARQSLLHELTQKQQETYEAVVDWFLKTMPPTYFRQTSQEARLEHLQAISAILEPEFFMQKPQDEDAHHVAARDIVLRLQREGATGKEVTVIQPGPAKRDAKTHHNSLRSVLESLPPADGKLSQVKVFNSMDGALSINVFVYNKAGERNVASPADAPHLMKHANAVMQGGKQGALTLSPSPLFEPKALEKYMARCEPMYVKSSHPRRFLLQRQLYEKVSGTEGVAVQVEPYEGSEQLGANITSSFESNDEFIQGEAAPAPPYGASQRWWITMALANVLPKIALFQVVRLLEVYNMEIVRCHLDVVDDPGNGNVTLLRVLAEPPEDSKWQSADGWEGLKKELKRLKWLDTKVMELGLDEHPWMGLARAEVVLGLAACVHGVLNKSNPWAFSDAQMQEWLRQPRIARHAATIADMFTERFDPDSSSTFTSQQFLDKAEALKDLFRKEVEVAEAQRMLIAMIDATIATLRTNLYMPHRYALGLRLDPKILFTKKEQLDQNKEQLFGAFFVYGRRFRGFHVRFRDIARGGLRIVTPSTPELVALEQSRHFDEAYNLAHAQQLKNKDIPEGGAKAVVLLDITSTSKAGKQFATRKSVKAFTDSLLDLTVDTDETRAKVVDFLNKQELLYLGPDEQIVPADIDWIVDRARRRGLAAPQAFMSSKPRSGINHKEYGVTSEGVFVFLDVALSERGLNPRDKPGRPVTLKLTGGPDGDVAGNMVRILEREYGEGISIVAMADGTGCAEDPKGLNLSELLRLANSGLPIVHYNYALLSSGGMLHDSSNEAGIRARNSMHFRVQSDVFVPAGGRPGTINKENWKGYLSGPDGSPSSPLIVEGANLFVTPEARQLLYDKAGVTIVKDSSANKCGVICSSFEVAVAMLLSEDEFQCNKSKIVADVLDRLRACARREAELLFREQHRSPCALPKASEKISLAINDVTDAISAELKNCSKEEKAKYIELLLPLFQEHLPQSLADMAFNRVKEQVPHAYLDNAVASCLASRLVYAEGVAFIAAQPPTKLGQMALEYAKKASEVQLLVSSLKNVTNISVEEKEKMMALLLAGGARTSLGAF